jgi:hypothetical protein
MAAKSMYLSLSQPPGILCIEDFHGLPGSRYRFRQLMPLQSLCYRAATALGLEEHRDMKTN